MNDWQRFFHREAAGYLDYEFTKNTDAEVSFMEKELAPEPDARFLDVGCGVGRHSIELGRRGYRVVGIDLSPDMLRIARSAAEEAGVTDSVRFVEGDASSTRLEETFDRAICMCEGAFSLLGAEDETGPFHRRILANIHGMLAPGGRLLLNALSALRMIRVHTDEDVAAGRFDDRQPLMPDGNLIVDPDAIVIRAAMFDLRHHAAQDGGGVPFGSREAGDPAH